MYSLSPHLVIWMFPYLIIWNHIIQKILLKIHQRWKLITSCHNIHLLLQLHPFLHFLLVASSQLRLMVRMKLEVWNIKSYYPLGSQELLSSPKTLPSYCIVGDNIDKYIKPRFERIGASGNTQLHYFHYFAALNRISVDELSASLPLKPSSISHANIARSLLPSSEDDAIMRKNVITLVSRILATHLETMGFDCLRLVDWHISHKYKDEMARKSEIVRYFMLYNL